MPIERVVTILTPVFAAVAAWLTGLIGAHLPGVNIDPSQIVALEIAGFTGAIAAALKWLHGRSQFVQAEQQAKHDLELAQVQTPPPVKVAKVAPAKRPPAPKLP